jgi:D-aminoacyl-tRNA deacylase
MKHILRKYPFYRSNESYQRNPVFLADIKEKRVKLILIEKESIRAQELTDDFFDSNLVVFISRHSSISGKPTLSVHTPGNLDKAELGGLPKKVSVSPATAMRDALKALFLFKESEGLNYEVSYECTHHGPSLNLPAMFVELGSKYEQWCDEKAAEAVAHATMLAIEKFEISKSKAVIGIGGPHYNHRFTHMALDGKAIFGHMVPKHAVHFLDVNMLNHCVKKTLERVDYAVLDWKGIRSADKPKLLSILERTKLSYMKI